LFFFFVQINNILFRYKTTYGVLELYRNSEVLYSADDNKTLGQTEGRDRSVNKDKTVIKGENSEDFSLEVCCFSLDDYSYIKNNYSLDNICPLGSTSKSNRF
jgi:hypothetical protein